MHASAPLSLTKPRNAGLFWYPSKVHLNGHFQIFGCTFTAETQMYQCFQPFSDIPKKVLDFHREFWYLCLLTKEATQMYNYMRTLQKQFEPQPEFFQNLDGNIRQIHKQLSARLEPEDKSSC